jgi:hypothetical protein
VRLSQLNDIDGVTFFTVRARQGQPAPGGEGLNFNSLFTGNTGEHPLFNNKDETAFNATLNAINENGIWFDANGTNLRLVVRNLKPPPGVGGTTFFTGLGAPLINDAGELAFYADLHTTAPNNFLRDSLWVAPRGVPQLVADSIQDTSGLPVGTETSPGGALSINSAGQIAYQALFIGESGITGGLSIDPGRNGIVRSDRDGVGSFSRMLILESGDLVFIGDNFDPFLSGLFYVDGGLITTAHMEGDAAPDLPGVMLSKFENIEANRLGQVAFQASLTGAGVGAANDKAIWLSGLEYPSELVVREGDALPDVGGNITFLALTEIGRTARMGDAGKSAKTVNCCGMRQPTPPTPWLW